MRKCLKFWMMLCALVALPVNALAIDPIPATTGTGSIILDGWGGTFGNFAGTTLNAQNSDVAGATLSLVGSSGNDTYIEIQFSMSGLTDLGISFATRGTATGFDTGQWSYSNDGLNFTNFGPNTATRSTTFQLGSPSPFGTTELNNDSSAFLRYTLSGNTSTSGNNRIDNLLLQAIDSSSATTTVAYWNFNDFEPPSPPPPPPPRAPVAGDLVFGLSTGSAATTMQLVAGPLAASPNGGVVSGTPWTSDAYIQSVEFDNYNGQSHNVHGNLLGVNFSVGGGGNSGAIMSFGTNTAIPAPAGQVIGNTDAENPIGFTPGTLTESSLSSVSVSPSNTKIAVNGVSAGTVIVYDYTPGDTMGSGAALANGRQTTPNDVVAAGATQGVTWIDDNTVLSFSSGGDIYEIDATSMNASFIRTQSTPGIGGNTTSLAYNPEISPYVYAMYGGFYDNDPPLEDLTANILYVLDPSNNYSLVHDIDLTTSLGTATSREIALDADGNLFISGYGGAISYVSAADLAAGTDNSSVLWYLSSVNASFNGIDIGLGDVVPGLEGDYNENGVVDAADYVLWRKNPSAYGGPGGYTIWKTNFGDTASPGGGGAVPEPASLALVALGCVALAFRRRNA